MEQKIPYILRVAVAMCFIGHGAFGIITKPIWCNYFAVFGIGHGMACSMMPVLGVIDILMGVMMLFYPMRSIAAWLVVWGMVTALLRPLSGEPVAEFIERAGNFGAPLALLILAGFGKNIKDWFAPIKITTQTAPRRLANVELVLRCTVFLILAGHGWLNLIEKKGLVGQYAALGFSSPGITAQAIGIFEIAMAVFVLIKPVTPLLLFLFVWKITIELFYPHYEVFEWIERGGSYGSILALYFVHQCLKQHMHRKEQMVLS